jgi:hypothetical protein
MGPECADRFPDRAPIREHRFPVIHLKFPVPISREFSEKAQTPQGIFRGENPNRGPIYAKFPVFSLMIREFAENGSQQTAPSATESPIIVSLLPKSRNPRVCVV